MVPSPTLHIVRNLMKDSLLQKVTRWVVAMVSLGDTIMPTPIRMMENLYVREKEREGSCVFLHRGGRMSNEIA